MDERARRFANRCGQAGSGTPPGSPPGSSGVGSMGAGGRGSGASGNSSPGSSGTGAVGSMLGSGAGSDAPMGSVNQQVVPTGQYGEHAGAIRHRQGERDQEPISLLQFVPKVIVARSAPRPWAVARRRFDGVVDVSASLLDESREE